MRFAHCFSLLLCVLVLFSAVFSPSLCAYATEPGVNSRTITEDDDSDLTDGLIRFTEYVYVGNSLDNVSNLISEYIASNGSATASTYSNTSFNVGSNPYFRRYMNLTNKNEEMLFEAGSQISFSIDTVGNSYIDRYGSSYDFNSNGIDGFYIVAFDEFSTPYDIEPENYSLSKDGQWHVTFTNPDVDVYTLSLFYEGKFENCYDIKDTSKIEYFTGTAKIRCGFATGWSYSLTVKDAGEYDGFFSGIIEWLRSIRDGILNVGDWINNVFTAIVELPGQIADWIIEGLKSLFIPDEVFLTDYKGQWEELLSTRFGAVYQAGDLVTDYVSSFSDPGATGYVDIPSVSVGVGEGEQFQFGGYSVELIPQKFNTIVTILKTLISIVCTFAFVNALKNRFTKLLGGDEI